MSSNRIKKQKIHIGDYYIVPIDQTHINLYEAKVKQIIDEAKAQAQQIISDAETKSNIIVETANNEATRIIEESRKRAQSEYDTLKQQGHDEGFTQGKKDGLKQFEIDAVDGLKALETLARSSFDMKKNIIDSATRDIVDLVNAIADKVCHQYFDDETLYQITLDAIRQLNDKEHITIIVSPKLVENVNALTSYLMDEIPKLQTVKILEDNSLAEDGVIVETPDTRLDSRVSAQIAEITRRMLTEADDDDVEQG